MWSGRGSRREEEREREKNLLAQQDSANVTQRTVEAADADADGVGAESQVNLQLNSKRAPQAN